MYYVLLQKVTKVWVTCKILHAFYSLYMYELPIVEDDTIYDHVHSKSSTLSPRTLVFYIQLQLTFRTTTEKNTPLKQTEISIF